MFCYLLFDQVQTTANYSVRWGTLRKHIRQFIHQYPLVNYLEQIASVFWFWMHNYDIKYHLKDNKVSIIADAAVEANICAR